MEADQAAGESSEDACPECGEQVIAGSDKCYNCGAPLSSGRSISLEMWEWGGGLIAALGFFLTPVLTAVPALYCALQVYGRRPRSAYGIFVVVLGTILFWIVLPVFILP